MTDVKYLIKGGGIAGGAHTGNNYLTFSNFNGEPIVIETTTSANLYKKTTDSIKAVNNQIESVVTTAADGLINKTTTLVESVMQGLKMFGKTFEGVFKHYKLLLVGIVALFLIKYR